MMVNHTELIPVALPPAGVVADFDNPQDGYHRAMFAAVVLSAVLTNFFFLIHAYVKLVVKTARLLQEDWFCIASWVFVNGFITCSFGMAHFGVGRMMWEVTREDYETALKFLYTSTTFYTPAAFCTKVTLLLLIARVFSVHRNVAIGIRVFIVVIFLAYVPILFMKIFICRPISAYWDGYATDDGGMAIGPSPDCGGQAQLFQGDIMISIVTDFMILILPIPMAWRMQASRWQKMKIMFLLGAGGAATVTTVVRAWLNVQFMHTTIITLDFALSTITSVLELAIGLLCACLPSTNLLFEKRVAPKLKLLAQSWRTERDVRYGDTTDRKSSSYWSSLKSVVVTTTVCTFMHRSDFETRPSRRRRRSQPDDPEACSNHTEVPEVFNNRLDMPSIGSTTGGSTRSSREIDHRGPEDAICDASMYFMSENCASRTKEDDVHREEKDSVMDLESHSD